MSFLDNLESSLKNLETSQERGEDRAREVKARASEKERALAAAPYAEALKTGPFAQEFLAHATRIGFSKRVKVQPIWIGSTLRLQARELKLEFRPTAEGVLAVYFEDNEEKGSKIVSLEGTAEQLASAWLDATEPQ